MSSGEGGYVGGGFGGAENVSQAANGTPDIWAEVAQMAQDNLALGYDLNLLDNAVDVSMSDITKAKEEVKDPLTSVVEREVQQLAPEGKEIRIDLKATAEDFEKPGLGESKKSEDSVEDVRGAVVSEADSSSVERETKVSRLYDRLKKRFGFVRAVDRAMQGVSDIIMSWFDDLEDEGDEIDEDEWSEDEVTEPAKESRISTDTDEDEFITEYTPVGKDENDLEIIDLDNEEFDVEYHPAVAAKDDDLEIIDLDEDGDSLMKDTARVVEQRTNSIVEHTTQAMMNRASERDQEIERDADLYESEADIEARYQEEQAVRQADIVKFEGMMAEAKQRLQSVKDEKMQTRLAQAVEMLDERILTIKTAVAVAAQNELGRFQKRTETELHGQFGLEYLRLNKFFEGPYNDVGLQQLETKKKDLEQKIIMAAVEDDEATKAHYMAEMNHVRAAILELERIVYYPEQWKQIKRKKTFDAAA